MEKCPYWTDTDLSQVLVARSFKRVGEIALAVLGRFPIDAHGHIAQVCGPITTGGFGIAANRQIFRRAVQLLRATDVLVFDQMPLEAAIVRLREDWMASPGNHGRYCTPILEEIYYPLFASGLIGKLDFLPESESSTGSRWEMQQGTNLGMIVEKYPEHLYRQIVRELGLLAV